jgi:hypothetical protein
VYVVLFVVGTMYSDRGHRNEVNTGWILIGLRIFFLLWFIAALRRSVAISDREGILTTIVTIGGTIYVACALVAVALNAGIRTMSDDTFQHRVLMFFRAERYESVTTM